MGTSNVTLYAIYSKEITVTYKYYNNQTTTETKTVYNKTTSATFTLKEALGTPEGYTFRGWSETDAANATVLTESKVTLTASKTYCASYETTVEATFHYCYSEANKIYAYTYGTTTTTGRKYMGYAGAIVHSEIVVPDIVKNNGNYYSTEYGGVAIEPSSTDGVTPTTEHTVYYAFYQGPLTYYYYDGINHISSTTNKNVILNGTKATIKIDNVPTPSKYDEAEYKGWSWKKDSVEDRKPAQTSVTELYAYYKKTITATFNYHNGTEAASETATATRIYISQAVDTIPNVINNEITIPDVVK